MLPFVKVEDNIAPNIKLTIIDIEELDETIIKILDDNFVLICEGNSGTELDIVKKYVINLFEHKSPNWKKGAIAEFFVHLYLKLIGYKQECLFLNLEEGSIKKGFDGFYSINCEGWIMESKAGDVCTKGVSHKSKVQEAMKDLSSKVSGEAKQGKRIVNPWRNAYNHACHADVGTNESIKRYIKDLSDVFNMGKYHLAEEFNTIPCGTVFLLGEWIPQNYEKIINDIKDVSSKLMGKQIFVICITIKSIELFCEYIGGGI